MQPEANDAGGKTPNPGNVGILSIQCSTRANGQKKSYELYG